MFIPVVGPDVLSGYAGKILRIDLSKRRTRTQRLDKNVARNYIGGTGLGAWILFHELALGVDPLAPENKLVLTIGPLTGTIAPCSSHLILCAKSPLTNIWGESHSGGFFPAEVKFAGYDTLIVEGRADKPVYLSICNEDVEIKDADGLWGKDTYETTEILQDESPKTKVMCIGPAGEKLCRIAAVLNDKYRAAGRTGMGAVMGSKNLKAIGIIGTGDASIAKPEAFYEVVKEVREILKTYPGTKTRRAYGTGGALESIYNRFGNLPTKYWKEGTFENAEKISGVAMAHTILDHSYACFMCMIGCGRFVDIKTGPYRGVVGGGPEYEALGSLGSLCLNEDLESIAKANELCNRLGLDVISTGSSIAFAMECYERGLVAKRDFDLSWGDHRGIVSWVQKIGMREGFGDILADGVRRTAEKLGSEAKKLAVHVKGLELPMHDPRAQSAIGLVYATCSRGAAHKPWTGYFELFKRSLCEFGIDGKEFNTFTLHRKVESTKILQDLSSMYDSLILCMFATPPGTDSLEVRHAAALLSTATGFKISVQEFLKIGERIFNLKRLFNVREGITKKDDMLPRRILKEPHSKGFCAGRVVELEPMLEKYYELRNWTRDGIPTRAKLCELDIHVHA